MIRRLVFSCAAAAWVAAAQPVWSQSDFSGRASLSASDESSGSVSPSDRRRVTELYEKGNRFLNAKRYAEAEHAFMDALDLAPGIAAIHHGLGLVYVQTQEYELAVLHLEEALKRDPGQAKTIYTLAKAHAFLGENEKAKEGYREAIRLRPTLESAYQDLAGIYHREKQWDEALSLLERARILNPRSARTLTLIGVTGIYAGRQDVALDAITQLRQIGKVDQARRLEYRIFLEKQKAEDARASASARS